MRTGLIGETLETISAAALIVLKPVLEIEDPDGESARATGTYTVRCVGWELVNGSVGNEVQRSTISNLITSTLRSRKHW